MPSGFFVRIMRLRILFFFLPAVSPPTKQMQMRNIFIEIQHWKVIHSTDNRLITIIRSRHNYNMPPLQVIFQLPHPVIP